MKKTAIFLLSVVSALMILSSAFVYAAPTPEAEELEIASSAEDVENISSEEKLETAEKVSSKDMSEDVIKQKVQVKAGIPSSYKFKVASAAKNASIKINCDGDVKIELLNPAGMLSSDVNIQEDSKGKIINIISPISGEWTVNITSDTDQEIAVIPHVEYEISIEIQTKTTTTTVGDNVTYSANITKNGVVDDSISKLKVKLRIKGDSETETKDMVFVNDKFECVYSSNKAEKKEVSVLVDYNNDIIESEPLEVMIIEDSNKKEGLAAVPWIQIIIVCIPIIVILVLLAKYKDIINAKMELRPLKGSIDVTVILNGEIQSQSVIEINDFGKSETLYNMVKSRSLLELQEILISGLDNGIKVINTGGINLRFTHVSSDPEGVFVKNGQMFKIFMSDNRTEVAVKYIRDEEENIVEEKPSKLAFLSKFKKQEDLIEEEGEDEVKSSGFTIASPILTTAHMEDNAVKESNSSLEKSAEENNAPESSEKVSEKASGINLIKPEESGEESGEPAKEENVSSTINSEKPTEENNSSDPFGLINIEDVIGSNEVKETDEISGEPFPIKFDNKSEKSEEKSSSDIIDLSKSTEEKVGEVKTEEIENPFSFIDLGESAKEAAEEVKTEEEIENPFSFIDLGESEKEADEEIRIEETKNPFSFIDLGESAQEAAEKVKKEEPVNPFNFIDLNSNDELEFVDDSLNNLADNNNSIANIDVPVFKIDKKSDNNDDPFKHIENPILDDIPITFLMGNESKDKK